MVQEPRACESTQYRTNLNSNWTHISFSGDDDVFIEERQIIAKMKAMPDSKEGHGHHVTDVLLVQELQTLVNVTFTRRKKLS